MDDRIMNLYISAEKVIHLHKTIMEQNKGITKLSDQTLKMFDDLEAALIEVKDLIVPKGQ